MRLTVIEELTKLLEQLQNVQEMGCRAMPEDAETIEVDRGWWAATMAVVSDAIDLLGTTPKEEAAETDEEFVERMVRENSVHATPYLCSTCGHGSDDTDAIDWDVLYGHERCKNPQCPNHKERS